MEPPPNGGAHLLGGAGSLLPGGGRDPGFSSLPSPDLPGSHHGGCPAQAPSPSPPLCSFGAAWSVQAAASPPTAATTAVLAPPPSPEASDGGGFCAPGSGLPSSLGPAFLQSCSAAAPTHTPAAGLFGGPFSPAPPLPLPPPPQPSRRSPASPQQHAVAVVAAAFLQQRNSYNHHQVGPEQRYPLVGPVGVADSGPGG